MSVNKEKNILMTIKTLSEYLDYDATTGQLFWKHVPGKRGELIGQQAGSIQKNGYRLICFQNKKYQAHKVVWYFEHGVYPDQLDHKDIDRDNNHISNLRLCTRQQNNGNQKLACHNTTGFKGIRKGYKDHYTASISQHGKAVHLGTFDTPEKAAQAYDEAALSFFGSFAKTNKEMGLL